MNINANLTANGRDIRLNLFLGLANWFIFLDHIPNNFVNWITARNYGFSGAADLFIFISGYTTATNLASFPEGDWDFNPFCWQLLFVFGACVALEGASQFRATHQSTIALYFAAVYLAFALVMTMAGRFPEFGAMFPAWLFDAFNPNDKENLAPYRVLHFIVVAFFVTRFVPEDWSGLNRPIFRPLVKCGEQSLAVFCAAVFLSFAGHFILTTSSGSVVMQLLVSATGIAVMTSTAYYISWSKQQDAGKTLAHA
ncbi:MAG: OpgC domain-containing protein [Bradyrhizobium sp.]